MNENPFNTIIPKIDQKRTRKRVDEALERYRLLSLQGALDEQAKITTNYSITPPTKALPSSMTERTAIKNADYEINREKYMNWIHAGVNRLPKQYRQLVYLRYLQKEELFDYQTYMEMNVSERTYYTMKGKALEKLGYALRLEVYEE